MGEETFNQCLSLLLKSLNNDNIQVRYRAALALININSDAKVGDIIQAIEDENYLVRCNAVIELGKFNKNKAVIPLIKALTEKNPLVRSKAAEVLAKFHSDDVTYALIQALNDKFPIVRSNAVKSLGNMNCEQVLKYLINSFKDQDSNTRHTAVTAIVNFTKDSNNKQLVINYLISALTDEESFISAGAAYTLRKIAHFSEEQSKYDLIESVLNKESPIESFPTQIGEIIEEKFLPQMQNLLLIAKNEMKDLILDVQTKYKYYNHEIFRSPPVKEDNSNNSNSTTNIFNAPIGIVNTGDTTIQGNQIGTQNNQ
ncbi:MAG: HEAT repeat domain-containing protein [Rivularia sp. (in: cyanobacteria)]